MPFQPGNQLGKNRTTPKEFADALRVAVKDTKGDKVKLRIIAETLVQQAMDGEIAAIKEIGDRLDGKAVQGVHHGGEDGGALKIIMLYGDDKV